ncbi:tyrosine-type recombinase/integrase [Clostridium polynesiense]|uniref:tyrosine-type recombinase/integrase n=1 Tax=Clostridium polynesiense TaxID=1325933 RepID=UPI000590432F|nr:tyrosine-type recombinase/integrase [Clostridium polynesiense]
MNDLLEEFYDFLEKKRLSNNSIKAYISDITDFKVYLDVNNINYIKVNNDVIYNYVHSSLGSKSVATVTRKINTIKKFYRFLLHNNYKIDKNILLYNAPQPKRKTPEFLSQDEIDRIISLPDSKTFKGIRDKALLEVLYGTGLKVNEIIDIKTQDIDINLKFLKCQKGKKQRVIPLGTKSIESLKKYLDERKQIDNGNDYLFINSNYDILTRQGIWKIIKHYISKAGINKEINLNTFRHSFALHLLENGADINIIQELLGLKGVNVLQIYLDVLPRKKLREIYNTTHPRA